MNRTCGVDPGAKGAVALLCPNEVFGISSMWEMGFQGCVVGVEQPLYLPIMSRESVFRVGESFGAVCAHIRATGGIVYTFRAQEWQKHLLGKVPKGETKQHAIAFAHREGWGELVGQNDNKADAVCIAIYTWIKYGNPIE